MDGIVTSSGQKPHQAASHVKAHRPQHTKTLMRHAVRPPHPGKLAGSAATVARPQSHGALQPKATHVAAVTPKLSSAAISPLRAHRARYANRSQSVEHFRPAAQPVKQAVPVATQITSPAPLTQPYTPQLTPISSLHPQPQSRQQSSRPLAAARRPYQQPAVSTNYNNQSNHDEQNEQDLFDQALAQAISHEQPAVQEPILRAAKRKGSRTRRVLAITASFAVFVALCGLVAFQQRHQIQLQMASAKAGFAASTPLYMPQDYKAGKMTYVNGTVATIFEAKDKQPFIIVQKKSNWDSQTLLDNFVAVSNQDYRGFQSNGRTVYVIGKSSATWVNGGIWYQIKEASNLNDEQLVKIAASM
jgi:hypothetical protein